MRTVATVSRTLRRALGEIGPLGVFAAGVGLAAYGLYLAWPPLGFIGGGITMATLAVMFERRQQPPAAEAADR